jgi:hypothetical protein
MAQSSAPHPRRCVEGLLLWQGSTWLVLAAAGLAYWIATRLGMLTAAAVQTGLPWRVGELVAIAIGAGIGGIEVTMAGRLRSARKVQSVVRHGTDGVASAAGLIVIWVSLAAAVGTLLAVA